MKQIKINLPRELEIELEARTEDKILKELNLILSSFSLSKLTPYTNILDSQCKGFIAFCETLGCSFDKGLIVCLNQEDWDKESSVYKGIFKEELDSILKSVGQKELGIPSFVKSIPGKRGQWPGVPFDQPKPRLSSPLIEGSSRGNVKPIIKPEDRIEMPPPGVPPNPYGSKRS